MKKKNKFPNNESLDEGRFEHSKEENFEQSKPKKYRVVFRQNRSFELLVGRELLRFESGIVNPVIPKKYNKGVPAEIINHIDFQKSKEYFNVMED